jgi:hypothetical protein
MQKNMDQVENLCRMTLINNRPRKVLRDKTSKHHMRQEELKVK